MPYRLGETLSPPSDQTNATAGGLIDPAVLYGRTYRTAACIAHHTIIYGKERGYLAQCH